MLILGFFGVGKTTIKNEKMADLTDEGQPSLSLLQSAVSTYDVVMADPMWEDVFLKSGIPFYVVVPSINRKEEFLANFRRRCKEGKGGGSELFCKMVGDNWEKWITHLLSLPALAHIELEAGDWLSDAISHLSPYHTD